MFLDTDLRHLFPGQQENERVCLVFRQHWMVMVGKLVAWAIFLAIFISIDYAVKYIPFTLSQSTLNLIELVKLIYLMVLFLGLFILWIMYYLNVNIITNARIVDITQMSLLHHTVSELHLNQIEDVTAETNGIFQTFFNYGNVYIQTAGETERFEFTKVPNPSEINRVIMDLYEELPEDQKRIKS